MNDKGDDGHLLEPPSASSSLDEVAPWVLIVSSSLQLVVVLVVLFAWVDIKQRLVALDQGEGPRVCLRGSSGRQR